MIKLQDVSGIHKVTETVFVTDNNPALNCHLIRIQRESL